MPLIAPQDKRKEERTSVALSPDVAINLKLYGEYTNGSSPSHIVNEALRHVFKADKEFQEFRKLHGDEPQREHATEPKKRKKPAQESAQELAVA